MYLSALLIVKDEHPEYILEWQSHHAQLGVEHFYILDHDSTIPIPSMPNTTIKKVHGGREQVRFYMEALSEIPSEWTLIVDTDEFVVCDHKLPEFLEDYEYADAFAMNWLCFGSDGYQNRQYPVHGTYTSRTSIKNPMNMHIKSIVKTKKVRGTDNPHFFFVRTINEKHQMLYGAGYKFTGESIRINHYFTRSREDWAEKLARGRADCEFTRSWADFDEINGVCMHDADPTHLHGYQEDE